MNAACFLSLARKELHHMIPLILALFAIEILGWYFLLSEQTPDTITWSYLSGILTTENAMISAGTYFVIGLVAAYRIFPHEREHSTLNLLWSLPVSRWQVYFTKVLATSFILLAIFIISQFNSFFVHSFNVNSVTQTQFSWKLWWLELALGFGVCFVGLAIGLFASWFRVFGVLAVIIYWISISVLEAGVPALKFLNPSSLLVPDYRGEEILFSVKAWSYHLVLASLCFFLAGRLWTSSDQDTSVRFTNRLGPRVKGILTTLAAAMVILSYLSITMFSDMVGGLAGDGGNYRPRVVETEFYRLSHYARDEKFAQLLQLEADEHYRNVEQLLGISLSGKVVADLTDTSDQHLGIAGWKKLRMRSSALRDADERAHVFVHETVHVLVGIGSDRRMSDHADDARFFSEGIAEWASYETLELDETRNALRILASAAWTRHDLKFDDLMSAAVFAEKYDENVIYAIGEAWVSSLARACGQQAPGDVVRAMADLGATNLAGEAFWASVLNRANCDYSAVNTDFLQLLSEYAEDVETIPTVHGGIRRIDDELDVTLELEGITSGNSYTVTVRVRQDAQVFQAHAYSDHVTLQVGESANIVIPSWVLSGDTFQYQLGIEFIEGERVFYGPWIDASY